LVKSCSHVGDRALHARGAAKQARSARSPEADDLVSTPAGAGCQAFYARRGPAAVTVFAARQDAYNQTSLFFALDNATSGGEYLMWNDSRVQPVTTSGSSHRFEPVSASGGCKQSVRSHPAVYACGKRVHLHVRMRCFCGRVDLVCRLRFGHPASCSTLRLVWSWLGLGELAVTVRLCHGLCALAQAAPRSRVAACMPFFLPSSRWRGAMATRGSLRTRSSCRTWALVSRSSLVALPKTRPRRKLLTCQDRCHPNSKT
jgi:hypothetical protein